MAWCVDEFEGGCILPCKKNPPSIRKSIFKNSEDEFTISYCLSRNFGMKIGNQWHVFPVIKIIPPIYKKEN